MVGVEGMVGAFGAPRWATNRHLFTQANREKFGGGLLSNIYMVPKRAAAIPTRSCKVELTTKADLGYNVPRRSAEISTRSREVELTTKADLGYNVGRATGSCEVELTTKADLDNPIFLSLENKWLRENVEYDGNSFLITEETVEKIDEYNKNKDEAFRLFKLYDRRGRGGWSHNKK